MVGSLAKILVVDDEEYVRNFFCNTLSGDYEVTVSHDAEDGLEKWKRGNYNTIILDVMLPRTDGITMLRKIREKDKKTTIIMISGYSDSETVARAINSGANKFFAKPLHVEKLKQAIGSCLAKGSTTPTDNDTSKSQTSFTGDIEQSLLYSSQEMENIVDMISRAANVNLPVLILGESGTGKELVAREIHARSTNYKNAFFSVNCGAIPETLLEPTLFGYEKGAFTGAVSSQIGYFEAAEKGVIFLDEIADTSPAFQVKLLRVLQDGVIMKVGSTKPIKINTRVFSATNADLENLIKEGKFRRDLFYRLNVIKIDIPPLRERQVDIPLLFEHFLQKVCEHNSLPKKQLEPGIIEYLMKLPWEGNIRELRNLAERLAVISKEDTITYDDLPPEYKQSKVYPVEETLSPVNYLQAREEFERKYIRSLLEHTGNDLKKATDISGLSLVTIYRKRNKL